MAINDTTGNGTSGKSGGANTADWREIAQRIEKEDDSGKMIELVQQLIDKLDEEKLQKSLPRSAEPKSAGCSDA
jgi:hypothetical protein